MVRTFLLCLVLVLCFGRPGYADGITPDNRILAFKIPVKLVSKFFNAPQADSVIFILKSPLRKPSKPDTSSFREMIYFHIGKLSAISPDEDYLKIIRVLRELDNTDVFRLFYKGNSGTIYKFKDHALNGVIKKEVTLIDPSLRMIEIIGFYKQEIVLSRSQMQFAEPADKKNIDSLWFGLSPQLIRSGKQTVFYPNGSIRSSSEYDKGKLVRVVQDSLAKKDADGRNINYGAGKAFMIGIDKYKAPPSFIGKQNMLWNDLAGCVNDIDSLEHALTSSYGFRSGNIMRVTDDLATRQGLMSSFDRFVKTLKKGDFVFIHYSGQANFLKLGGKEEFAFICRDAYLSEIDKPAGYVSRSEFEKFLDNIASVIGRDGQLFVSLDACHTGNVGEGNDRRSNEAADSSLFRGETNNLLFNFSKNHDVPVVIYTSASANEFAMEIRNDSGMAFGAYSLSLIRALRQKTVFTSLDLFQTINTSLKLNGKRQTPTYYANFNQVMFESNVFPGSRENMSLPALKKSGNAFVLSVGISQYSGGDKLKFTNCVNDAASYASFFESQFLTLPGEGKFRSWLLTDTTATNKNILLAINDIIFNSKPDDYFVFNFSGYCRQLTDSSGKQVTYFVPYGVKNIADTNEIKLKGHGIPLSQLKDLLQLIPANNQLFITEAGSTNAFQKEFIQALIESSPTIAALSNKNRIFMVPRSSGLDKFYCDNIAVEHGPLNYYITHLADELNVYGVFENGLYSDAVKYSINKTEVDCDFFRTGYFDTFFEREYISDLQHFLPEELSQSRGLGVNREAKAALAVGNSKRYALVVGTDKYQGKPDWSDLRNPVLDAKDIAAELAQGFGYSVKLLLDAPMDSIYTHIAWLSRTLKANDQLIIYMAGHGDFDSTLLDDGFIVCRDSKPINQDPYRNSYIQYSKFSRMINRLPAKQILMALDVCFGGTFDERVARNEGRERTTEYDNLSNNSFLAAKLKKKTRLYLTSGGKDVVPDGLDKKHSPFALRLLQALQGRGGISKMLTAKNLHQFVEKLPSGPLLGSFGDDEVGSEFILLGN